MKFDLKPAFHECVPLSFDDHLTMLEVCSEIPQFVLHFEVVDYSVYCEDSLFVVME